MANVFYHRVSGAPPKTNDIPRLLGLVPGTFRYVVATQALEREREQLVPQQKDSKGKPALVFHKALRLWVGQKPLSRALERVALQRAADTVASTEEKALQIKTDVMAWREALVQLAEEGVDLSKPWPPSLMSTLVNQEVGQILTDLQTTYRSVLKAPDYVGQNPFEEVVRAFLNQPLPWTPGIVVMEGFTFFTPLQQAFLEACRKHGDTIHFLFPYRFSQSYGFAALQRTYQPLAVAASVTDIPTPIAGTGALGHLQMNLFADAPSGVAKDSAVSLQWFSHRHHEVANCIRKIQDYVTAGIKPDQIAIVQRNADEFSSLIAEEAERQKLTVGLSLPPRLLLLRPVGRFVLTLYDAWKNNGLDLTADQFGTLLASGWLGSPLQKTTDEFNAVKAQMFAQCRTLANWQDCFKLLKQHNQKRLVILGQLRAPAALIDEKTVERWEQAVQQVEAICQRLFVTSPKSIEQHVKALLDELSKLNPLLMRKAEQQVREGIEAALSEVQGTSVKIKTEEFVESLVGMAPEEQERVRDRIWVTTPEGIDGVQCAVVFYLGADNQRLPRRYPEPWPFYRPDVNQHQEKERYYFLGVVRAALKHLHLSYSRADEKEIYRPSPFLDEALRSLGWPEITEGNPLPGAAAPTPAVSAKTGISRRPKYTLEELLHYRLCPFRYKLERLDPATRAYRSDFQLGFVAQGEWLRLAFDRLAQQGGPWPPSAVQAVFKQALDDTRDEVQKAFPGLRPLAWVTIEAYVRRTVARFAEDAAKHGRNVTVLDGMTLIWPLPDARATEVEVQIPHTVKSIWETIVTDSAMHREWLLPGQTKPDETVQGVPVFASQGSAQRYWWFAVINAWQALQKGKKQAEFDQLRQELLETVTFLSEGKFPKHQGDHCKYCSVRSDCLGLEP